MRQTHRALVVLAALSMTAAAAACRGGEDEASDEPVGGDSSTGEGATSAACPESSPGLTEDKITFGGSYPLSGPAAAYSVIPGAAGAWFDYLNETQGGFKLKDGTTLEIDWKVLDDAYEPPRALQNVRQLVERDDVFLVLNPLGTPPNSAIRPYMNQSEVPQLFVATGASMWGNEIEEYPWTIGLQPDYESEGVAYAQHILSENPNAKIGILYQNDDFGADYLAGIKEGLAEHVDQIVSEVSYEVTDASIDNQVSQIKNSGADTFISITTPTFAIQSIQRAAALNWNPLFVLTSVSSSVAAVIRPAGPANAKDIVSSVYLKDPSDPGQADDPALKDYRKLLADYAPDLDPEDGFSVYGVDMAQIVQALFEGMDGPICRASVMEAAKNFSYDPDLLLDGITVETGPGDGFPISQVQLQRFDGEKWVKFGEVIEGRPAGGETGETPTSESESTTADSSQ